MGMQIIYIAFVVGARAITVATADSPSTQRTNKFHSRLCQCCAGGGEEWSHGPVGTWLGPRPGESRPEKKVDLVRSGRQVHALVGESPVQTCRIRFFGRLAVRSDGWGPAARVRSATPAECFDSRRRMSSVSPADCDRSSC